MSDSSRFSNILIVAFFSAIALIGMFLINFNADNKTVAISDDTEEVSNRVYLVDEETSERFSRIGIYIDPVLDRVETGSVVIEYTKDVAELNDVYMENGFTGLNQQVDGALGKARIEFSVIDANVDKNFKLAELYFVRKSDQSFQVKLSDETSLDSSTDNIVLNSLEVI